MTHDPAASHASAAESLGAMRQSQAKLAAAADCPPARHLAFAAVAGGYVAAPAAPFTVWMVLVAVLLLAVGAIVQWDKRRTGVFVNGWRNGATRPLTLAFAGMMLTLYAIAFYFGQERHDPWTPLALGAVTAALAYPMSARWQRIWRRELGVAAVR